MLGASESKLQHPGATHLGESGAGEKPVSCLEYIVVHELAHLLERHHNERFVAIMDKHLPTWCMCRKELDAEPLANETWSY